MNARDEIVASIEKKRDTYIDAACKIWDNPELAFHEDQAADILTGILEKEGFSVKRGLAGMSTAFHGRV